METGGSEDSDLELVRQRLNCLFSIRLYCGGFTPEEAATYEALCEREEELIHAGV